ncbi:MAG: ABC transporter ATP-binding protein [Limisphaerales bacterium]
MPTPGPLLRVQDVWKSYEGMTRDAAVHVLNGISFDVNRGESVAIVGPSGSGKSTLLNIIGTLDSPSRGKVFLENRDLSILDERQIAELRNFRIGFVFQAHFLLPQCTVMENVMIPTLASPQSDWRQIAQERALQLFDRVGLRTRLNHRPGQLSGGERQRVAVVRALINQPQLLLADEPTGALDSKASEELSQLLVDLNAEGKVTLIVVTHAPSLANRMKRILHLTDGRISDSTLAPAPNRENLL